jgi:hypothetical protein
MSAEESGKLHGQFFDPEEGTALPVTLDWDEAADMLRIRGEGLHHEVRGSSISVATGGTEGRAVFLSWAEGPRGYAIGVTDRETLQGLATLLSASLARELERAIVTSLRIPRRRSPWTYVLWALLFLAPIVAMILIFS